MKLRNLVMTIVLILLSLSAYSQPLNIDFQLTERNLGGPRLGVTYVHGNGELVKTMKRNKMDRLVSQFGWHFEYQVSPTSTVGPAFVVQFIPLIGGVEYGKAVPSLTTAFGIRFPNGYEFGMGPNVTLSKDVYDKTIASSSLVIAGGMSLDYGGVSIPLNIAYAISPRGNRASFIFGYALD